MKTTSPYRSLEPATWRFLMVLGVVFLAASPKLSRLSALARRTDSAASVLTRLSSAARDISGEDDDDAGIVSKVVQSWEADIEQELARHSLEPDVRRLLTQLRKLLDRTVAHDPYRSLFDRIVARARGIYGDAWRPAVLSVAHLASHPRGPGADRYSDPYPVSALTPWPPDESNAEIELLVYCDWFGPEAFAAVPMLLTHECVCHVPARQDRAKNDSPFAEGFVDWAACHFLNEWAADLGPEFAPAVRQHAGELRQILMGRTGSQVGWARRIGHEAAENLFAWLEFECGLPSLECRARVARLAVELNQMDRPIALKDQFVSTLEQPFPADLAEALRGWIRGDLDTDSLLEATPSAFVGRG